MIEDREVQDDYAKGTEPSTPLPGALPETRNKMSLVARLGSHNVMKMSCTSLPVNQAREKFLERQKEYIIKLTEKRKTEREEEEQEHKKHTQIREKLRDKVKTSETTEESLFQAG